MSNSLGVIFDFNGTLFLDDDKHVAVFKSICNDFIKAANQIGKTPENCIVFEDSVAGIRSANSAKIKDVFRVLFNEARAEINDDVKIKGTIKDFTNYKEILNLYL